MTTYVLVHGAFRGGWWWRGVRLHLQSVGHEVFAPSLSGMGDRVQQSGRRITRATWVKDIADLCFYEDLSDVVLVGHSLGGLIAAAAVPECGGRIAHLVYLDAPVPPWPGVRSTPERPLDRRAWQPPLPVMIDGAPGQWMGARLTANPVAPGLDPVAAPDVATTVIFCGHTPEAFPAAQSRRRLDEEGRTYLLLGAGHDVAITHPGLVADALLRVAGTPMWPARQPAG